MIQETSTSPILNTFFTKQRSHLWLVSNLEQKLRNLFEISCPAGAYWARWREGSTAKGEFELRIFNSKRFLEKKSYCIQKGFWRKKSYCNSPDILSRGHPWKCGGNILHRDWSRGILQIPLSSSCQVEMLIIYLLQIWYGDPIYSTASALAFFESVVCGPLIAIWAFHGVTVKHLLRQQVCPCLCEMDLWNNFETKLLI